MNDFYTFIVLSTVNTAFGEVSPDVRFTQTLETLDSIKLQVPDSKILFMDNSIKPLTEEQIKLIKDKVDIFKMIDHNIFTLLVNSNCIKGMGEIYMMFEAMQLLRKYNMIGKRIFKLSGRYRLAKDFTITAYNGLESKYVFKINVWDISTDNWKTHGLVVYFETRLWSFCHTLFDEYFQQLPNILTHMFDHDHNLEITLCKLMPHDKVVEFDNVHVEGFSADTGIIKIE